MARLFRHPVTHEMRGFSLVELMVAMAISLLLLAGVIAIFASSRSSYETTDKMSRIQENGRYALDQLTYDVRSAGYVGCSRATTYISSSLINNAVAWDFTAGPVLGFQYVSAGTYAPALPAGMPAPVDGSDILVLRMPVRDAVPLELQADMATGTSPLILPTAGSTFKAGDIAMAYSCEANSFFQVTGFAGGVMTHTATGQNAVDTINYAYRAKAEVVPVNTVTYYIDQNSAGTPGVTSLFRQVGAVGTPGTPEELVEGIDQMQIDYGVDTTGDDSVDVYQTADVVADWKRVFSVRVALLVRSLDQYGTEQDTKTYTLLTLPNAVAVPAPMDRSYREVFTSTIGLRNKVVIN